MTQVSGDSTEAAQAVLRGREQAQAIPLNDFIYMSQDVSNCYLVTTAGGNVAINAGSQGGGPQNRARFAAVSQAPLRYLVLTQSHTDHFGGVEALLEPGTTIIAQADYPKVRDYWLRLNPFYTRRSHKLWVRVLGEEAFTALAVPPREVQPHVLFEKHYSFTVGERRFELLATPGGETTDSLVVWLPEEKVVFTGNLFGPLFMNVPNFNTLRGDRMRSIPRFLESLACVQALGAEMLVTGHGEPVRGAAEIESQLMRLGDAVRYLLEQTLAGMNAGKDMHALMREIRLPESLSLGEAYGSVSWAVRTIWTEYAGWFNFDTTTSLYDVPVSSVAPDLLALAGGTAAVAARAEAHTAAGEPLKALHLVELTLPAAPADATLLRARLEAQRCLLASGNENFHATMWLNAEIAEAEQCLQQTNDVDSR